jgi:hypothetical protein
MGSNSNRNEKETGKTLFELRSNRDGAVHSLKKLWGGFCNDKFITMDDSTRSMEERARSSRVVRDLSHIVEAHPDPSLNEKITPATSSSMEADTRPSPVEIQPRSLREVTEGMDGEHDEKDVTQSSMDDGEAAAEISVDLFDAATKNQTKEKSFRILEMTIVTILAVMATFIIVHRIDARVGIQFSQRGGAGMKFQQVMEAEVARAAHKLIDIKKIVKETVSEMEGEKEL